jgi:hypothetical protein
MAASKSTSYIVQNSVVQASATYTSGAMNVSTYYGTTVTAQVVNSSTAGTIPATVTINASPEGTYWFNYQSAVAGIIASSTYNMTFIIDPNVSYYQVVCIGSVGGTYVTFSAEAHNIIQI